jgi:hypothetical protein
LPVGFVRQSDGGGKQATAFQAQVSIEVDDLGFDDADRIFQDQQAFPYIKTALPGDQGGAVRIACDPAVCGSILISPLGQG